MRLFDRITKNIGGFALGIASTWGSSGAYVFQSFTK